MKRLVICTPQHGHKTVTRPENTKDEAHENITEVLRPEPGAVQRVLSRIFRNGDY